MTSCHRGTSNTNSRGNSRDRRARREFLVATYRADVDVLIDVLGDVIEDLDGTPVTLPLGEGEPCCRCYRCGDLLTVNTVSADRILAGVEGGEYRTPTKDVREGATNIRPCCGRCNSVTGAALGHARRKAS